MDYRNIKTYGRKNIISKVFTTRKGYIILGFPLVDDWKTEY